MRCGVGHRCGSDPALLWLWHRLAATAPINPLAWEPPYAMRAAKEMAKRQKKKKIDPRERSVHASISLHCQFAEYQGQCNRSPLPEDRASKIMPITFVQIISNVYSL